MSTPFILRPIATILLIVAIVALGLLGYRSCRLRHCPMSISRRSRW
jgi:multidrug efflux pump subunit AcrB